MFALILTVCVMSGNLDKCDESIIDSYPTITECLIDLDYRQKMQPLPDDRFRSCKWVERREIKG